MSPVRTERATPVQQIEQGHAARNPELTEVASLTGTLAVSGFESSKHVYRYIPGDILELATPLTRDQVKPGEEFTGPEPTALDLFL